MSDDLLASIVWKYAAGPHHKDDLLQEARIAVWQAWTDRPGQYPSYYIKIVNNRLISLVSRRFRYFGAPERDATSVKAALLRSDDGTLPEPVDERSEPSSVILDDELLREYPHFYLSKIYGLPIREVAATLGETFKFARNRLEAERVTFALEHGRLI